MKKKLLSGLLIGAFVFGVGATSVQPVNAASLDTLKEAKDKFDQSKDKFRQMRDGDSSTRPTPPTDSDGKPMPPPNNGDNSNRPTPQ